LAGTGQRHTSAEKALIEKIEQLSLALEKMKLAEYVDLLHSPKRLMYVNLLAGFARGVGSAAGWAILAALLVAILRRLVRVNLPLVGSYIADLVLLVQSQLAR
jgi:hypothetical protein